MKVLATSFWLGGSMGDFSSSGSYLSTPLSRGHVNTDAVFFCFRFSTVDGGHMWTLIRGHINRLCGETPTDFRMGVPALTTNFLGLAVRNSC
jgi:hypothetical protein